MKSAMASMTAIALALSAGAALATEGCDEGEIVMKFAHVTNADKHPKPIMAAIPNVALPRSSLQCAITVPSSQVEWSTTEERAGTSPDDRTGPVPAVKLPFGMSWKFMAKGLRE